MSRTNPTAPQSQNPDELFGEEKQIGAGVFPSCTQTTLHTYYRVVELLNRGMVSISRC